MACAFIRIFFLFLCWVRSLFDQIIFFAACYFNGSRYFGDDFLPSCEWGMQGYGWKCCNSSFWSWYCFCSWNGLSQIQVRIAWIFNCIYVYIVTSVQNAFFIYFLLSSIEPAVFFYPWHIHFCSRLMNQFTIWIHESQISLKLQIDDTPGGTLNRSYIDNTMGGICNLWK